MGAQPKLRTKEELDGALKVVESIFETKSMEASVYYKLLVSLAYEYSCIDHQQEALVQLSRVPASYFQEDQLGQMREDSMYAELVVLFSYKLIQAGVLDGSEELLPVTMPPGQA